MALPVGPTLHPNRKSRDWGHSRRGRCANLSQIARQTCAKLLAFRFVHQRKGAQNCRKLVANLKVNFGQFYANTPVQCPLLEISEPNPPTISHRNDQAVVQGVPLQGDAPFGGCKFEGRKGSFCCMKKGPENRTNEVKLRPPLSLKHLMK